MAPAHGDRDHGCRPRATSGPSARPPSASCCGWTRCAAWRASCRCWRSTSAAIFGGIFIALCLKAVVKHPFHPDAHNSFAQAKDTVPFAFLVAVLLFARSGLYAERAVRPGLTRIVGSLFQTMVVTLVFAIVNGEEFTSYYIFYGSLFFAVAFVSLARFAYEGVTGVAAARGRLPPPRGARRHRAPHRGGGQRAQRRAARRRHGPRLHLARRRGRTTACARSARSTTSTA